MTNNWLKCAVIAASLTMTFAAKLVAAPSTTTFMNAMTVCSAGIRIEIDANLQGSMVSLYEKEAIKGRAVQNIMTDISKLIGQDSALRREYIDCLKDMMSR